MAEIMKKSSVQLISGLVREKAIKHILNVLDFDNALCQFVKSRINFNVGTVFSVIPSDSNAEDIADFSWGFGKGSDNLLSDRILRTLKLNAETVAVFDDVMGSAENVASYGSCLANNNEVYHWIIDTEATDLKLKDLIRATGVSWHFLCVVFELNKSIDIKDCIANSRYDLFGNILEVVIGAFDGEGYIHWLPQ
jgi:hypothetical protein